MSPWRSRTLTVVVATSDRAALLTRTLESLRAQSLDPRRWEVVVVDDGSTDATREAVRAFEAEVPLRYAYQRRAGRAQAMNHGVFMARGELLLFLDDAVVADRRLLARHLRAHRWHPRSSVAVVGRAVLDPALSADPLMSFLAESGALPAVVAAAGGRERLEVARFGGGRTSCKRSLLMKHGVFHAMFRAAPELELAFRLSYQGLTLVEEPRAVTTVVAPLGLAAACALAEREGEARLAIARLHEHEHVRRWTGVDGARERWERAAGGRALASAREVDRSARERLAAGVALDAPTRARLHAAYAEALEASRLEGLVANAPEVERALAAFTPSAAARPGSRTVA